MCRTNAWPWGHVSPKLPHLDPPNQPTLPDSPPPRRGKSPPDPPPLRPSQNPPSPPQAPSLRGLRPTVSWGGSWRPEPRSRPPHPGP